MSEYQYYEFQALDRPLREDELRRVRAASSRATVTPTRWTNVYSYGDFRGDASEAERVAAEKRARYLDELAGREEETWSRVESLVSTKQPARYDEAAALLRDLRDLAARDGRGAGFEARILALRERHARKPSFLQRIDRMLGKATGFV